MTTMRRVRWASAVAGAAVGVLLLSACNPISQAPTIGASWSTAKLGYDGPGDAWIEVGVSGLAGYQVDTRTAVWVPQSTPPQPPVPRQCRSATDRAVIVTCNTSYPEFPYTELHRADQDAPGTYWPAILVHPGEQVQVMVYCARNGTPVVCPVATKVEARSVDAAGGLIGDLRGIT
jgi:hypothetical protein